MNRIAGTNSIYRKYQAHVISQSTLLIPNSSFPDMEVSAPTHFHLNYFFPFPLSLFPPDNISKCPAFCARLRSVFATRPEVSFYHNQHGPVQQQPSNNPRCTSEAKPEVEFEEPTNIKADTLGEPAVGE